MASRFGGAKGKEAQRATAVHHIEIATGRIQPAAVYRQTNHVAGAEALRRRGFWRGRVRCPDYLYAYGLGACFQRCAGAGSRTHPRKVWGQLSSGEAEFLQVQEGCAGGARSGAPDRSRAHTGRRAEIFGRRPLQTVPVDLAAVRGVANVACDL